MRQLTLMVPSPAEPGRLDRFLCAQLHGLSRRAVKGILDAGQVRIDGRTERKAGRAIVPGQRIVLDWRPSMLPCPAVEAEQILVRGDGWLAIHKPPGLPSHRPSEDVPGVPERLAELLGVPLTRVRPAHRLDRATSGVLLVALEDGPAAELSRAFERGVVAKRYLAVVSPAPREDRGDRTDDSEKGPMHLSWEVAQRSDDGTRAELIVVPSQGRTHQIRQQLAAAGTPIVGDLLYGTALPHGAPRMALHCAQLAWDDQVIDAAPCTGWADLLDPALHEAPSVSKTRSSRGEPMSTKSVAPRTAATGGSKRSPAARALPILRVSAATARVLAGGHPWVLPDRDTGDLSDFSPGDQALLVDTRGRELGVALVDPGHDVVARLLDSDARSRVTDQDLAQRAERALQRRRDVLARDETDCGRLISGEADELPGLVVDRWGDVIIATRATRAARALSQPVLDVVMERFPNARLYEKDHIVDLRRRGQGREGDTLPGRWLRGGHSESDDQLLVREAGLSFRVEPFAGLTTGLYPDQRGNRDRMARLITPKSRVANLFAHTAAFSVRAAAEGAARAVSVDLSPRYCAWAEENLVRNGLAPALHPVLAQSSGAWLSTTDERFNGVIVDPPAFARARKGEQGWSARRDYKGLMSQVARVLDDGPAWLLCIINLKGVKPSWLRQQVEAGVRAGGRVVQRSEGAPPSHDFPSKRGFPEGRPFVGLLAHVAPRRR